MRNTEEWIKYFEKLLLADKYKLKESLKKPCTYNSDEPDCAITTNFYLEYAEGLKLIKKVKPDLYKKSIQQWFCHNNRNKICKGLLIYLNENIKTIS